MKFNGNNHDQTCKNLAKSAVFDSISYPEFKGDGKVVSAECVDNNDKTESTLLIKVNSDVKGDLELPPDEVELPLHESAPNIEIEETEKDPNKKDKLGPRPIAGIVIGVVFVAIVAVLVWYFVFHKKKDTGTQSSVGENVEEKDDENVNENSNEDA